jgi:hypothetical protein
MAPQYVLIKNPLNHDEILEIPKAFDGAISFLNVERMIPGAFGLRYMTENGHFRRIE